MSVRWFLWIAWIGAMSALGLLYLTLQVSPDQALFDYIAWSHLQGDLYYADIAEQNFPGKMLMHELGIRLFGVQFWTFRAIDFLVLILVTLMAARLMHQSGFEIGAWAFLWLYPVLYTTSGPWMAGQRDIVAAGLLFVAALAASGLRRPGWRSQMALAGVIVAVAVLIRPTYLSYLVGLLALIWIRLPGETRLEVNKMLLASFWLTAGFLGVISAIIFLGARIGALDDFFQQTILFNVEAYQVVGPRSRLWDTIFWLLGTAWHWVAALGFLGLVLWLMFGRQLRVLMLVLGLGATVLVSYFAQNKGFVYHLGGLLTVLTFFAAVGVDRLAAARSGEWRFLSIGAFAIVLLLCAAGSVKKLTVFSPHISAIWSGQFFPLHNDPGLPQWADTARAIALIKARSEPNDFVLQWGRNFHLPYLAERRSTLRFVSTPALVVMTPSFSGYDDWLKEVARDLQDKKPRFAIVDVGAVQINSAGKVTGSRTSAGPAQKLVMDALAGYQIVESSPQMLILEAP